MGGSAAAPVCQAAVAARHSSDWPLTTRIEMRSCHAAQLTHQQCTASCTVPCGANGWVCQVERSDSDLWVWMAELDKHRRETLDLVLWHERRFQQHTLFSTCLAASLGGKKSAVLQVGSLLPWACLPYNSTICPSVCTCRHGPSRNYVECAWIWGRYRDCKLLDLCGK